jgi:gamma-glutamylcyclotransferase (GGCT)/AIG2-like uncharacterized protein YtfP
MKVEDFDRLSQNIELLFVPGALRRDAQNKVAHLLTKHAKFVGRARFRGKLFDLGDYPGAIPLGDPQTAVYGEVYALEPSMWTTALTALDKYDGCGPNAEIPTEFHRGRYKRWTINKECPLLSLVWPSTIFPQ